MCKNIGVNKRQYSPPVIRIPSLAPNFIKVTGFSEPPLISIKTHRIRFNNNNVHVTGYFLNSN